MSKKHVDLEETYDMLEELEHIRKRPDTFVGSCTNDPQVAATFDLDNGLVFAQTDYVPGLVSIFDEILVNAADHKTRNPSMTYLNVVIKNGKISVKNNGPGIPVQVHAKTNMWLPQMIFGHLRTSSNYKDHAKKKRLTGGRNGYGAKLTNIFSKSFGIKTTDTVTSKSCHVAWTNGMSQVSKPKIKELANPTPSTTIDFEPDMAHFKGVDTLEQVQKTLAKRVLDIAGTCSNLTVKLNGTKMPVRGFKQYAEYVANALGIDTPVAYYKAKNSRWEVALCAVPHDKQEPLDISFVNHIATTKGGNHARAVRLALESELRKRLEKQLKTKVSPSKIRSQLCVFVSALIENPSFSSQTKEELTTRYTDFGSYHQLDAKTMTKLFKTSNIIAIIEQRSKGGLGSKVSKTSKSRSVDVPKLQDANFAGTKKSQMCRLFITEGDSAKTLAISGREKAGGPNINGVYPLRGKLYNPCAGAKDTGLGIVDSKAELKAVVMALNLKPKPFDYAREGRSSLRYGQLVIMADQDTDGAHIAGLFINFLKWFNPTVLALPNFFHQFITPVIKAKRGKVSMPFFSKQAFDTWASAQANPNAYTIKYYKGLGTSTAKEAKEYFANMSAHLIPFEQLTFEGIGHLNTAFSGQCKADRKAWISQHIGGGGGGGSKEPDFETRPRKYKEFLDTSLMEYNGDSLERAIPRVSDGFKEVQRKVLFGAFSKNVTKPLKVSQLQSIVQEVADYHHGEASMSAAIVGMAQHFVGKNNINLLFPDGQFGTRLQGGNDAASPRYIFTKLMTTARLLFPEADDHVLDYVVEEGRSVQPANYAPIIPMVLVNGANGIATGWSTKLPMHNPLALAKYLLNHLHNQEKRVVLEPWYRGFKGTIEPAEQGFVSKGVYEFGDNFKVRITELPVGTWTEPYLAKVAAMTDSKSRFAQKVVTHYQNNSSDVAVDLILTLDPLMYDKYCNDKDLFEKDFRLTTDLDMTNIHLLDIDGKIKKYTTVEEIMLDFIKFRYAIYEKRKAWQLQSMQTQIEEASHKVVFILGVVDETIPLRKVDKQVTIDAMLAKHIPQPLHDKFLAMALSSLHTKRVDDLQRQLVNMKQARDRLRATTIEQLWIADLDKLVAKLTTKRKANSNSASGSGGSGGSSSSDSLDVSPTKRMTK